MSGFVIAAQDFTEKPLDAVRVAAQRAGLDPALVRDIRPRSAFIRAARSLVKQGVLVEHAGTDGILRDKIADEKHVVFQFSARHVSDQSAEYVKEAVISFDKESQAILVTPDNPAVHNEAVRLFTHAGFTASVQDLHAIVDRAFSGITRQIMLRRAVYYVPSNARATVETVRAFLGHLGLGFLVLQVSGVDTRTRQDIRTATAEDVRRSVAELTREISQLNGDLTGEIARNRIEEIRRQLRDYEGIARSLETTVAEILRESGTAGQTLELLARGPEAVQSAGGEAAEVASRLAAAALQPPAPRRKIRAAV